MRSIVLLQLLLVPAVVPAKSISNPKWNLLPIDSCGSSLPADRIIGGEEAALGQFPWMVRLAYQLDERVQRLAYLCAGSIISRWYVITANHCLEGESGDTIKQVQAGENILHTAIDCLEGVCAPPLQDLDVDHFVRYNGPKLQKKVTYGDIALIKVAKPIRFHDYAQPICLPTPLVQEKVNLSSGTTMTVAGWGSINPEKAEIPKRLMQVEVPINDLDSCRKYFRSSVIDDSHICAGVGKGRDSCIGDSGGPLMKAVSVDGPPRYFLFGVVSYGSRLCGRAAAVYTNVSHHVNWILDNIDPIS